MACNYRIIIEISVRLVLAAIYLATERFIKPFNRVIPRPAWDRIIYPHKPDTVSILLVAILAFVVPLGAVIAVYIYNRRYLLKNNFPIVAEPKNQNQASKTSKLRWLTRYSYLAADIIDAFHSYVLCILVNGCITNFIKLLVGRPRPDFFNRCFLNDVDIYDNSAVQAKLDQITSDLRPGNLVCTNPNDDAEHIITEGRKSFPSGHSSTSFAAFGFVAFYIWGKTLAFTKIGQTKGWRFLAGTPFMFLALFVVISRTQDYRHHWEDVTVGSIIGLFSAYVCYRLYYPRLSCDLANLSYRQMRWVLESDLEKSGEKVKADRWNAKRQEIIRETAMYGCYFEGMNSSKRKLHGHVNPVPVNQNSEV